MIGEVLGDDVGVRQQDIADGLEGCETQEACERTVALRKAFHPQGGTAAREIHLCKSFHIVADDLRVGTLQLADDFKALIELGEHVDHGAGEQSVLRRDLELESQKKRQD